MATKTRKPTKTTKSVKVTKSSKSAPAKKTTKVLAKPAAAAKSKSASSVKVRQIQSAPARGVSTRLLKPARTGPTFAYMRAPGVEHVFEVGDTVEVFCDHEKNNDRVRGWIKGIVVQVDNKMVAVQFRSNVFLTDGWMVPDRILWYPVTSDQIRAVASGRKAVKKDFIPEY